MFPADELLADGERFGKKRLRFCFPCPAELPRELPEVEEAGGKGQIYGAPTVSDGIAMGTEGMKYSLASREVIADSIEVVSGAGAL